MEDYASSSFSFDVDMKFEINQNNHKSGWFYLCST